MYETPYPPCDFTDKSSFAYTIILTRLPAILNGIAVQVNNDLHDLSQVTTAEKDKHDQIQEGQKIVELLDVLKYWMSKDMELEPIQNDGDANVDSYNAELARIAAHGKNTWFKAPWFFAECYLYRLVRSYFALTKFWRPYDPFLSQKRETLRQSGQSIFKIASSTYELNKGENDPEKIQLFFKEMLQMCLWGNATDLSLLLAILPSDLNQLQSVGKEAYEARKELILRDDQEALWNYVKTLKNGKVDIVLDNAGFELFTDLVFADFLVTYTPYVSKVVFHPKLIPWFVSDVTPADFKETIGLLQDSTIFRTYHPSPSEEAHLSALASRLQGHLDSGKFALSVDPKTPLGHFDERANFWTEPWAGWDMKTKAGTLWETLSKSQLVIFKGDYNYRKLTGDLKWPASTPVDVALGPLAGSFPLLSLRTIKADVVVGIDQEVADRLDKSGELWRSNGRYALISYLPSAHAS